MIEHSLCFGEDGGLVGTVCLPRPASPPPAMGFLMFNAGVIHRIGPHRINVRLARALADDGVPSMRFDLAGQGDSARPLDTRDARAQVIADVRAAMDALGAASGARRFILFGFCSGGYQGLDVALADERIAALSMFDAYIYATARARYNRYRMRIRQHGLARAVTGWAGRALRAAWWRVAERRKTRADHDAYLIGLPSRAQFAQDLRTLLTRDVAIHLVYAGEGFEHFNYAGQFADAFREFDISGRVTTHFFPDMDHVATALSAQAAFIDHLRRWVRERTRDGGLS